MEKSPYSAIAPLLVRNMLSSTFIHAYKTLIYLSEKHKLLQLLHTFLVGVFLFILTLLPSQNYPFKSTKDDNYSSSRVAAAAAADGGDGRGGGGSAVARALSQVLLIMSDIPVSSRKYEVVRSLADKLIDENNLLDDHNHNQALREINCAVLTAAFARSLTQLEAAAVVSRGRRSGGDGGGGGDAATAGAHVSDYDYYFDNRVSRLLKGVKNYGGAVWSYAKSRNEPSRSGCSAEKLAAEILWLARKMVASGCADEAICKWASASKLARLALSAEPRLQGSLVKISGFLIKEVKELDNNQEDAENGSPLGQHHAREIKIKILTSWLPLLCRANNGIDAPILTMGERAELETVLEEIISTLDEEEEQERVLSLWLHHFTYCPASDWPNLRSCYTRWYEASRTRLLLAIAAPVN